MAQRSEPEEGTLGWRMKQAAKASEKSAEQIAFEMKLAGTPTSDTSVRRWWKAGNPGGRRPRGEEMAAYASVVGVTVEELMGSEGALSRGVMDALVMVARGLQAGEGLTESVDRAIGRPGSLPAGEETRLATEAAVMRRFFQDLGALSDQDLRALLQDLHDRARSQGRRGGSTVQ